jgi:tryptophan-rich sensory protein
MNVSYVIIPLAAFVVTYMGGKFSDTASRWYDLIARPWWAPPGSLMMFVGGSVVAIGAIATVIAWNSSEVRRHRLFIPLVCANVVLCLLWPWSFFSIHSFALTLWVLVGLAVSAFPLVLCTWGRSRAAAIVYALYFAGTAWAAACAVVIWFLNR